MTDIHLGGCLCGNIRYETIGQPEKTALCHCRYCQLRSGSAFGVSVYFDETAVTIKQGTPRNYSFVTQSGRTFTTYFCDTCATTVFWRLELFPNKIGVAAGTFDPPSFWFELNREVFTRNKAPFLNFCLAEAHETSSSYSEKLIEDKRFKPE